MVSFLYQIDVIDYIMDYFFKVIHAFLSRFRLYGSGGFIDLGKFS